jgi:hypothetical protein
MTRLSKTRIDTTIFPTPGILIFTHIPKTGGMAIYETIKLNFPHDAIIGDRLERNLAKGLDKISEQQIRCYYAHTRFDLHRWVNFGDTPTYYAAFLRDPVHREASYYYYRKNRNIGEQNASDDVDIYAGLAEWFSAPERPQNVQTHFLSGYGNGIDLDLALSNLRQRYAVIGITERMNECIDLMAAQFGFNEVHYGVINASPNRSAISDEAYQQLSEMLWKTDTLDMTLYEEARKLVEARLDDFAAKRDLSATIATLRASNDFRNNAKVIAPSPPQKNSTLIVTLRELENRVRKFGLSTMRELDELEGQIHALGISPTRRQTPS